jgi:membrane-associated phospholipid phosphatase
MWIALVLPYGLMLPMIVAAMLLPTMTARFNVAKRLTVSCLSSLALGTAVFFFLPAIGPWAVYGFKPNRLQIDCENALKLLRAPGTVSLGKVASAGLICFPSFHVALALLALSALWQFRRLRYPAAVLSILQIISTLTTGWHYFADVLGGFVVAGFGLVCAHWFEHAEARWNARHGWLIASAGAAVSPDTGRPAEVPKAAEPVLAS